ncbi:MAG: S-methyl-5-thioribose-1-phosphate isomerase [Bacteroidetes bacterium RBG_19FT_COMBO_42_10]|nr:MAG: S-methyl-5-thioribose-1-phosphate isomerase [Bacteroidetes bacterium RBG_19FT_COMBO_42_10]
MRVGGKNYKSIWLDESDSGVVRAIDQQKLPFFFEIIELHTVDDVFYAIKDMTIRGAPVIGAAGAFGIYLATLEMTSASNPRLHLGNAARYLVSCRPTAVNLSWAVNYVMEKLERITDGESLSSTARKAALEICEKEEENCRQIGIHGLKVIESISRKKDKGPVNILTHCNAGWLACIDYGTVTSPVYLAHEKGIPVHVWVDETRPLNQGARLTAWELGQAGVPHTLVTDNTGGHLMQHGMVDIVMVGSDRTTGKGDVANKIGTYLKALAAFDNKIPFYSVFPSSSLDPGVDDGLTGIPVEERDPAEVTTVSGLNEGKIKTVRICPENTAAANYGFDITPAKYITGLITEKGICKASEKDIKKMFSDKFK